MRRNIGYLFLLISCLWRSTSAAGSEVHPYYKEIEVLAAPDSICNEDTNMLIIIHSATKNAIRREQIRKTYANEEERRELNFTAIFVLGTVEDGLIDISITNEYEENNDLLIGDFKDSYSNNTIKMLFWMRYVAKECPKVPSILHIDDDVVLDLRKILADLTEEQMKKTIHCLADMYRRARIIRNKKHKWYVSTDDYERRFFPDYCAGAAYIFPGNVLFSLINAFPLKTYISIDDALLTGITRVKAKVRIKKFRPLGRLNLKLRDVTHKNLNNKPMVECGVVETLACMQRAWNIMSGNATEDAPLVDDFSTSEPFPSTTEAVDTVPSAPLENTRDFKALGTGTLELGIREAIPTGNPNYKQQYKLRTTNMTSTKTYRRLAGCCGFFTTTRFLILSLFIVIACIFERSLRRSLTWTYNRARIGITDRNKKKVSIV